MAWVSYANFKVGDRVTNTTELLGRDGYFSKGSDLIVTEYEKGRYTVEDDEGHVATNVDGDNLELA